MSSLRTHVLLVGAAVAAASAPAAVAQSPAGKLVVEIQGFRNTSGQVIVSLFNNDDFPDQDDAFKVTKLPISGKTMTVEFPRLTQGTWAVTVVHDENSDGEMNQWLGFGPPKEGVGASRNPDGIPRWPKCRFKMAAGDRRFSIKLNYLGKD